MFEAIPQLFLNFLSLLIPGYSRISFIRGFAIMTSTLTITFTITSWIVRRRQPHSISSKYHPWCSFLGTFLWILLFMLASFLFCAHIDFYYNGPIMISCLIWIITTMSVIGLSAYSKAWAKFTISIMQLLLTLAIMITLANYKNEYRGKWPKLRLITPVFFTFHLILGFLVLPSPSVGARLFNPVIKLTFRILRKVSFGMLEDEITILEQWERNQSVEEIEMMEQGTLNAFIETNNGPFIISNATGSIGNIQDSSEDIQKRCNHGNNGTIHPSKEIADQ